MIINQVKPDFLPFLKKAQAIVADEGGITSHSAIVSRELKKPCIIGTKIATQVLKDGDLVEVEVAQTVSARERGLSGRKELVPSRGMLFVYPERRRHAFWMKDMNFPIDIIWIGEDLKVIYIKKDARPELYPEIYGSERDSKYILEVESGFSEKNNLKEGDEVRFY
mgnify:CR=1 FL=1